MYLHAANLHNRQSRHQNAFHQGAAIRVGRCEERGISPAMIEA
jgi:hypothetical protein